MWVSDLVKRLRECQDWAANPCLWGEAADRIERLETALRDMIEISQRNSQPELMLLAIRQCAQHALAKQGEK
jgi:hypothetical protein